MAEMIEEQEAERPDVERFLNIIRRRHMHLLIPFFLTWLIVWGSSWILKPLYKSSTQILVEQPTMPANYVAPNVNDDLQARLQSITQQILSTTRLSLIINKLNLYPDPALSMDDKVGRMRDDISVDLVRDARSNDITSFEVSFSAPRPEVAQQVTTELTNLFISENIKVRQEQSAGTTKFIQDQLETARVQLAEQEAKVRAFEGGHEGILPSQQTSNLQILAGMQAQLQNEQDALTQAKQQRVYVQAMIDQNRALRSATRPDGTPTGLAEVNQQLERLRTQLVDLSSRYTDQYPDVVKLKEQIAKTEKLRDELLAAPKKPVEESAAAHEVDGLGPASPIAQLQGQLKVNQAEIANHEHRIDELQQKVGEYQGRLNAAPTTEQELAEVTRGYEQSKQIYDELLKKKNDSEMATSMEQMQQGEHFSVLDPPSLPLKPDFPNRIKFCGIGLGLGLLIGAIVAGAFEFADDRMYNEADLKAALPMTILTEVPEVAQPSDEAKRKRKLMFSWAMAGFVVLAILAGTTLSILKS
jgi:succinoglycan biosynthesis transport protein ExoP